MPSTSPARKVSYRLWRNARSAEIGREKPGENLSLIYGRLLEKTAISGKLAEEIYSKNRLFFKLHKICWQKVRAAVHLAQGAQKGEVRMILVYRRHNGLSDLDWHFHTLCKRWPESEYTQVRYLNPDESERLCPECVKLEMEMLRVDRF